MITYIRQLKALFWLAIAFTSFSDLRAEVQFSVLELPADSGDLNGNVRFEFNFEHEVLDNGVKYRWDFRWSDSRESRADYLLNRPPLIRWEVHVDGRHVGYFHDRFEGVVPENRGVWGIGNEKTALSLSSVFGITPWTVTSNSSRRFICLEITTPKAKAYSMIGQTEGDLSSELRALIVEEALKNPSIKEMQQSLIGEIITEQEGKPFIKIYDFDSYRLAEQFLRNHLKEQGDNNELKNVFLRYVPEDPVNKLFLAYLHQGITLENPTILEISFSRLKVPVFQNGELATLAGISGDEEPPAAGDGSPKDSLGSVPKAVVNFPTQTSFERLTLAEKLVFDAESNLAEGRVSAAVVDLERAKSLGAPLSEDFRFLLGKAQLLNGSYESGVKQLIAYVQLFGEKGLYYDETLQLLGNARSKSTISTLTTSDRQALSDLFANGPIYLMNIDSIGAYSEKSPMEIGVLQEKKIARVSKVESLVNELDSGTIIYDSGILTLYVKTFDFPALMPTVVETYSALQK